MDGGHLSALKFHCDQWGQIPIVYSWDVVLTLGIDVFLGWALTAYLTAIMPVVSHELRQNQMTQPSHSNYKLTIAFYLINIELLW